MRVLALLLPVVAAVVACATPAPESAGEAKGFLRSKESGCSITREQILGSVGGVRREAITRGFTWLDDEVPYSQSASHEGYRTDCSGFVSMCWEAGEPGETTSSFAESSDYHFLDSYDDLIPGDAIDAPGHHVVLFLGWNDDSHDGICVLEQASTASDMQFRVRSTSSLEGEFQPLRPNDFPDDEALPVTPAPAPKPPKKTPSTTPSDAQPTPARPTPVPTPVPTPAPTCTPKKTAVACAKVDCGTVSDGCGGQVNCDTLQDHGCDDSATCKKSKCVPNAPSVEKSPGSSASPDDPDVHAKTQGEPGDVSGDDDDTSSHEDPLSDKAPTTKPASSGGCNAGNTSTTDGAGLYLALALAAVFVRRRRAR